MAAKIGFKDYKMKSSKLTKETVLDLGVKDRGFPDFGVGDTIQVAQKVKEGSKERIQMFKGDVIAFSNNGISTTFTVRRIGADRIGVEKIYPYFSPVIDDITVIKVGDIRRAKLYYIRERIGKAARIKEKIMTKEQKLEKLKRSSKFADKNVVAKEASTEGKKENS